MTSCVSNRGSGFSRGLFSQSALWIQWLVLALVFLYVSPGWTQSTFGSFSGTVKDSGGGVIPNAAVSLTNTGTLAVRKTVTNAVGAYTFPNIEPGSYSIEVTANGFSNGEFPGLVMQSRQSQTVDAVLNVGAASQTVTVTAAAAVVNTDTSNLSETRTGLELQQLPLAISSRASGSTSPFQTLTSQAGVQMDAGGNLSVAGAQPALLSVTVDGISTMNTRSNGPAPELFPSFAAIEEIQVSKNDNSAEFGSVSDITTVSKGGTNQSHGNAFENYETDGLNANNPFAISKPKIVMNDFGLSFGGPVILPKLYNGRNKTFYFLSYEGLRLPETSAVVQSVPTQAMRNGNLSAYSNQIYNVDGTPFANNQVPVNPVSAALLKTYFPLPNFGPAGAIANNFEDNFPTPISSDQGDVRIDQNFTAKQSMFARFSYKKRAVEVAPGHSGGSALVGSLDEPELDMSLTSSYNYVISPTLFNELRGGFSRTVHTTSFDSNSRSITAAGITGIPDLQDPSTPEAPYINITGFAASAMGYQQGDKEASRITQALDNFTWTKGNHLLKFGADYRHLNTFSANVFGYWRLGRYAFNESSPVGSTIGNPLAEFLLGYPDNTGVADVIKPDMNGATNAYAGYVEDSWKVTPSFTVNYGLRYEYHPEMGDLQGNSANFLTNYSTVQNGSQVQGAIVVPNEEAATTGTLPSFRSAIAPLPIVTAQQVGLPTSLVQINNNDYAPRIGFAWLPLHNDKTVLRGGWGRYIETSLGDQAVGGWGLTASALYVTQNAYASPNHPLISFPSPFQTGSSAAGTLEFEWATDTNYHDPTEEQWNLTVEQALSANTGLRISYLGSHSGNLTMLPDLNQLPFNTQGYDALYPTRPYPEMSIIQQEANLGVSNFNALTLESERHMSNGLQFQASYTFTRDLGDNGGGDPTGFPGGTGGSPSDRFNPRLDYGNVMYTSRHRVTGSFLYELPFGNGQRFLGSANSVLGRLVGDWQLASYMLFQSGPFMTLQANPSFDPTGTGISQTVGGARPDRVLGSSPYLRGMGAENELNSGAFAEPGNNEARQGTSSVGSVVGPGTDTVSASLFKTFKFSERYNVQLGAQAQNVFNHVNLAVPSNLTLDTPGFGQISSVQTTGNAGPRAMLLTGRLTF